MRNALTLAHLLKLRDTTYPEKLDAAPMLVGRSIQRDYEDWPTMTFLISSFMEV